MGWQELLWLVGAAVAGWFLYRMIRGNPQAFSSENLNKSLYTLGLLALGLIVFIGVLILLLKR